MTGAAVTGAAGVLPAAGFHPLTVDHVERLTDDAVAVSFAVPAQLHATYAFSAGQHLTLRRVADGVEMRRTYSICSSAADPGGRLRVAVKRLTGGAFSEWVVEALRAGDVLEVAPPAGHFGPTVDPAGPPRHLALVGAGSGVTPLLSIAATVLELERRSSVTLVYGNRTSREVMFLEELHDLKDRYPERLQLLHVLSREEQEVELLSGRIDADRLRRLLDTLLRPDRVDGWYLCGPFALVTTARETLLAAGVPPTQVHAELFHVGDEVPRPPRRIPVAPALATRGATVRALLGGRWSQVQVGYDDESVLDALLAVRGDAPYACKGGVCGTCRARVVEGSVEMDTNWALEPDEVAAGLVLTCQSHPTTEWVALEFG